MNMAGILDRKRSGVLVETDSSRNKINPAKDESVNAARAPNWSANLG